jgi:hypothetical protein
MSSSVGSADGHQLNLTCQQRPVEAMGSVAEAAGQQSGLPAGGRRRQAIVGRKSTTDDAAVDGRSEKMKLADEPGPVP